MGDDRNKAEPRFSRSGRVLRKTLKMKEMEDFKIEDERPCKSRRRMIHPPMKVKQPEYLIHGIGESSSNSSSVHGAVEPSSNSSSASSSSTNTSTDVSCFNIKSRSRAISYCQKSFEELRRLNTLDLSDDEQTWSTDEMSLEDGSSSSGSMEDYLKSHFKETEREKKSKRNYKKYQRLLNSKNKTGRRISVSSIERNKSVSKLSKRLNETKTKKTVWLGDAKQPSSQQFKEISERRRSESIKSDIVTTHFTSPEYLSNSSGDCWSPEQPESNLSHGTAPIDVAAHLVLLGECLSKIGSTVLNLNTIGPGVYSSILDMLLCSMGPLLCLTREIAGLERLPEDVFIKILDHFAYIVPGLL